MTVFALLFDTLFDRFLRPARSGGPAGGAGGFLAKPSKPGPGNDTLFDTLFATRFGQKPENNGIFRVLDVEKVHNTLQFTGNLTLREAFLRSRAQAPFKTESNWPFLPKRSTKGPRKGRNRLPDPEWCIRSFAESGKLFLDRKVIS